MSKEPRSYTLDKCNSFLDLVSREAGLASALTETRSAASTLVLSTKPHTLAAIRFNEAHEDNNVSIALNIRILAERIQRLRNFRSLLLVRVNQLRSSLANTTRECQILENSNTMLRSETASDNDSIAKLNSRLNVLFETHFIYEQLLAERRLLITRQLFQLFPVHVPRTGSAIVGTICNLHLPDSLNIQNSTERDEELSAAAGCAAHLVALLLAVWGLRAPYPLVVRGSRSQVEDALLDPGGSLARQLPPSTAAAADAPLASARSASSEALATPTPSSTRTWRLTRGPRAQLQPLRRASSALLFPPPRRFPLYPKERELFGFALHLLNRNIILLCNAVARGVKVGEKQPVLRNLSEFRAHLERHSAAAAAAGLPLVPAAAAATSPAGGTL